MGTNGDDIIDGRGGADTMIGGFGNDKYFVDHEFDLIVEEENGGIDTVVSSVSFGSNGDFRFLENITLVGSAFYAIGSDINNVIRGNANANLLTGGGGSDSIYGGDGEDVIRGGAGNADIVLANDHDFLYGGNGNDIISGEYGNDLLDGGLGTDVLMGGYGNDTYIVDNVGDVVREDHQAGYDRVLSSVNFAANTEQVTGFAVDVESIQLTGGTAFSVIGNALGNEIVGNWIANLLIGHGGNDKMEGRAGDDIIYGDGGILGNAGSGHDSLWGNEGKDTLYGEGGRDVLSGGAGADTLSGGTGADRFVFDGFAVGMGVDKVVDFSKSAGDILDFSDIFVDDPAQTAINEYVFARNSGANTVFSVDMDGAGTAFGRTDVVVVENVTNVSVSDWLATGHIDVVVG